MRPIRVAVLVVAVLAAVMTAVLARKLVNRQTHVEAPAQMAMVEVVVAARDVPAGAVLAVEDLRFDRWPADVAARLAVRTEGDDPRTPFAGQSVRRDLAEGEPVTSAALRRNSAGMLAGMLGAGNRAVSVAITNTSAAAGFVTPGDRVDVLLAADIKRAAGNDVGDGGPMVRFAAETVLSDVKVLAIDQATTRAKDGAAVEGKTATLEVSSKQAEILAAASMLGSLSLALRSADPADPAAVAQTRPAALFTADTEASRALDALRNVRPKPVAGAARPAGGQVMVNRAGKVSAESVGR